MLISLLILLYLVVGIVQTRLFASYDSYFKSTADNTDVGMFVLFWPLVSIGCVLHILGKTLRKFVIGG